jgi:LDH2 family malate/lactate/ureidoglycolate dehydrogenase
VTVPVAEARALSLEILRRAGVPGGHAASQVDLLLEADLTGRSSHGLLRLRRVVERIRNGVANPTTEGSHVWRSESFLEVDGEMGLGPVVALAALSRICERARRTGVAIAAIRNSNHLAMLAWYVERVAREGQVAIAFTTSEALVHPWGGRRAMVGTNPIAIGVPASPRPFVMDTATGLVSMGRIHDYAHRAKPLPEGWALDADGNSTTDAEAAKHGAIAPFGDAKGYALGVAFEVLVAALTATPTGTDVKGTLDSTNVCNKGDVFVVANPAHGAAELVTAYLEAIRACPPLDGTTRVTVPGDRSNETRETRLARGLPISRDVWNRLLELVDEQRKHD